jgi:hypothetical protein
MKITSFEDLMKYIEKYRNNPKRMSKIKKNFTEYIELCSEQNIMIFINEIRNIPEMENTLYYNSDYIYRKFGIETIFKMTKEMKFKERFEYIHKIYEKIRIKSYTIYEYIEDLIKSNEIDYICDNMEEIVDFSDIRLLIKLDLLKKLKEVNSNKFNEIQYSIICKIIGIKPQLLDSNTLRGLTIIVNEVAQNENVDISKLEYIGKGSLADVYKLGNKVIKFGENRLTDKIPYHKRILQPLVRRRVYHGYKDLYVEIAEYIKTDNEITDEDAYAIYKELREDGIIWLDAKRENLGRLEKDNIAHFNEQICVKNETVGYIPETIKKEEPLHKGDLVILDTDLLFRAQNFDERLLNSNINKEFYQLCEQRYQEEIKRKKNIIEKDRDELEI